MGKIAESYKKFEKKVFKIHDKVCNQKYADTLPYSTHLKFVIAQGRLFFNLLESNERTVVEFALPSHDIIEDGRFTYNNLVDLISETIEKYGYGHKITNFIKNDDNPSPFSHTVADIVYCVTDEKGKSRKERKNDKYYAELKENELAIFVKLADLAANTLFSKLSGNSMYDKYKKEFPNFKEKLYVERFKIFFDYIEKI